MERASSRRPILCRTDQHARVAVPVVLPRRPRPQWERVWARAAAPHRGAAVPQLVSLRSPHRERELLVLTSQGSEQLAYERFLLFREVVIIIITE